MHYNGFVAKHRSCTIRPIRSPPLSANHRFPSEPGAIPHGRLEAVGTGNSVILPVLVSRPTLFPVVSANQRFPSGPGAMPWGPLEAVGTANSVTAPDVLIRPTREDEAA